MSTDPNVLNLLAGLAILALIALAAFFVYQRMRSKRLQQRFGPEYQRAIYDFGSRSKAESELSTRERRVEKLKIVPLQPAEAARFGQEWKALQGRFVDDPSAVLVEADALVRALMQKRGYPMADFEHRAADISVDHPVVVDHYRAAQAIALRHQAGKADTEDLRKAVVHYRALFADLLEVEPPQPEPAQHAEMRS